MPSLVELLCAVMKAQGTTPELPELLRIWTNLRFGQASGWNQVWGSKPLRPVFQSCKVPKLGSACSNACLSNRHNPMQSVCRSPEALLWEALGGVLFMSPTPAGQAMI